MMCFAHVFITEFWRGRHLLNNKIFSLREKISVAAMSWALLFILGKVGGSATSAEIVVLVFDIPFII